MQSETLCFRITHILAKNIKTNLFTQKQSRYFSKLSTITYQSGFLVSLKQCEKNITTQIVAAVIKESVGKIRNVYFFYITGGVHFKANFCVVDAS